MTAPQWRDKPVSDMKRQRDVLLLYGAAIRGIPFVNEQELEAGIHVPVASPDSILTALCQLTAIRLGFQRAMISLIDADRQHILAEATCDQSLRPGRHETENNSLWLGNVSIPRKCGLGDWILDSTPDDTALVIDDPTRFKKTAFQVGTQHTHEIHFYISAILRSPRGAAVGTVCLFDDKPRDRLSEASFGLITDFAATISEYLGTYTLKEKHRRGERFTRGLVSFSEGASTILPSMDEDSRNPSEASDGFSDASTSERDHTTEPENTATGTEATTDLEGEPEAPAATHHAKDQPLPHQHHPGSMASKSSRAKSARHRSIRTLQESILPLNSRSMFSRAANVLLGASDLDGVLILDASVAANGRRRPSPGPNSGTDRQSSSYHSRSASSDEDSANNDGLQSGLASSSSKLCQVLGVATKDGSSEYRSLLEPDLARLLVEYSHGKIFAFTFDGLSMSSTDESMPSATSTGSFNDTSRAGPLPMPRRKNISNRALRSSKAIQDMFPGARSVAFVPFWDYERSRWFAGCLCWSDSPYRLLSPAVDLAYFKVFSHSIMRELSRLDALALIQSKTTFIASISHELRSPLHGILGTLEFIKDTKLDSFQVSMLNSLNACGQTLLDVIDNVMAHAKINETNKNVSFKRLKDANTVRLSSKPLKMQRREAPPFDLSVVTEEVVEAIFSGASYNPSTTALLEEPDNPTEEVSRSSPNRKNCLIILDLGVEEDWTRCFIIGSWRRILMNILGNAIKYTSSGFVHVSLRASSIKNASAISMVTLTVTDSGCGMSPTFLANKAFQPFSQENPHSVGTGLGLSIVRQIIETHGGKIEASSSSSGTKMTVKLALPKPGVPTQIVSIPRTQFLTLKSRLEGRRICILHRVFALPSENPNITRTEEGLLRFTKALVSTLQTHLKMNVVQTAKWEGHDADIVIVPELSFEYLDAIRQKKMSNSRAPITVFVAMDGLEASALRADARVTNRQSVVEIMPQPCGPYKLATILNRCLDRFALPQENLSQEASAAVPPQVLSLEHRALPGAVISNNLVDVSESSTVALPSITLDPPSAPTAAANTYSEASAASGEKNLSRASHVLVTDDNPINRSLLVSCLKKQKRHYEQASNGLEALNAYRKGSKRFDVILMDMSMPVMDGMTATRAIREYEQSNNIPPCYIIALTGLASPSAKLEAWNSGIDYFMTKPVKFKSLEEVLDKEEENRKAAQEKQGQAEESTVSVSN